MKNYYIAERFQMPIFFFFQTICWLMVITFPIAIILRIIHDCVADNVYDKNKDKSVLTIEDDGILINYKTINKKILFNEIKSVSSICTSITRFVFGGTRGFGFALETSNKTYGKIKIKTKDETYVLKYIELVKLAESEIKEYLDK